MTTVAQQLAVAASQGRDDVAAAQSAADEAADLVEALEEKVRAGGREVKPSELVNARELARIAELQIEAAERAVEQAQSEARHRAYAAYGETVAANQRAVDELATQVDDAFARARAVLEELWDLALARAEQDKEISRTQSEVMHIARQHNEAGLLPDLVRGFAAPPPAELAALPLDHLLVDKLAEHRLTGGWWASWSYEVNLNLSKVKKIFPHLAPPTVDARWAQLRQAQRETGGK
ncbi:hypothetical protein AB0K48_06330 [Nonomuraea sp. NPDC055795]